MSARLQQGPAAFLTTDGRVRKSVTASEEYIELRDSLAGFIYGNSSVVSSVDTVTSHIVILSHCIAKDFTRVLAQVGEEDRAPVARALEQLSKRLQVPEDQVQKPVGYTISGYIRGSETQDREEPVQAVESMSTEPASPAPKRKAGDAPDEESPSKLLKTSLGNGSLGQKAPRPTSHYSRQRSTTAKAEKKQTSARLPEALKDIIAINDKLSPGAVAEGIRRVEKKLGKTAKGSTSYIFGCFTRGTLTMFRDRLAALARTEDGEPRLANTLAAHADGSPAKLNMLCDRIVADMNHDAHQAFLDLQALVKYLAIAHGYREAVAAVNDPSDECYEFIEAMRRKKGSTQGGQLPQKKTILQEHLAWQSLPGNKDPVKTLRTQIYMANTAMALSNAFGGGNGLLYLLTCVKGVHTWMKRMGKARMVNACRVIAAEFPQLIAINSSLSALMRQHLPDNIEGTPQSSQQLDRLILSRDFHSTSITVADFLDISTTQTNGSQDISDHLNRVALDGEADDGGMEVDDDDEDELAAPASEDEGSAEVGDDEE